MFESVIPASVGESPATSELSITTYLERRMYWMIDDGYVSGREDDRIPIDEWVAKLGDMERIAVRIIDALTDGSTVRRKLPASCAITFGAIEKDDHGGPLIATATLTLDETDVEDPKYVGVITWDSEALRLAFNYGEASEDLFVLLSAEIRVVQTSGATTLARMRTQTVPVKVFNNVLRDDQQQPTPGTALHPGIQYRFDITGLTGGGAAKLDGFATAGLTAGTVMVVLRISGVTQTWTLVSGTDAENVALGVVRPDDYATSTNEKVWVKDE